MSITGKQSLIQRADIDAANFICPDIHAYWQVQIQATNNLAILQSKHDSTQIYLSLAQGLILQYFTGKFTINQIAAEINQKLNLDNSTDLIIKTIEKLIEAEVIALEDFPVAAAERNSSNAINSTIICPDLSPYWRLGKLKDANIVVLQAIAGDKCWQFTAEEGLALQCFTGKFTVEQVQQICQKELGNSISTNFVANLLDTLIKLEIIGLSSEADPAANAAPNPSTPPPSPRLKSCVQWIAHPNGYWILRNPEDVTFLQMDNRSQKAIAQLGKLPLAAIIQQQQISPNEMRSLLQLLAATAMLEGTKPPQPPKRKFHPLQLLSFKKKLFNPDAWLNQHIDKLRWIWTPQFCLILCAFLAWAAAFGSSRFSSILLTGQELIHSYGGWLILPFALLSMLVVTIHELGHAFTLKHYGGIVPEIGLLFMCFIPAAYTNTTDSYCLVKKRQRALVVFAGVLCQFAIAAIALVLWNFTASGTWLSHASYLLMTAALFTVAVNLNPLAKFDGYYLAVALSGINNLRSRSFMLYTNWLRWRPSNEISRDAAILAIYAPFSLAYILLVFGRLLALVITWLLAHIPTIALALLVIWAIYYYWPASSQQDASI